MQYPSTGTGVPVVNEVKKRMFKGLLRSRRVKKVASAASLAAFLDRNASLVSQKTVIGYCLVKTSLPIHELIKEKAFAEAYDMAVWEAYAAALADLVMVAESHLRPVAGDHPEEVARGLVRLHADIVAGRPVPANRPHGWAADTEALRVRLQEHQAAAPKPIREIAETAGERIFDSLPIHERLRRPDKPAAVAGVQFLMVGLAHEFEQQIDCPAVVAELRALGAVEPA
jgi:hypothetical protein